MIGSPGGGTRAGRRRQWKTLQPSHAGDAAILSAAVRWEMGSRDALPAAMDGIAGCRRLPCHPVRVDSDVGGWVWSLWPLKADTMPGSDGGLHHRQKMVLCVVVQRGVGVIQKSANVSACRMFPPMR